MLTPIEIQDKKLHKGIGYSKLGMDVFLKQLFDDYEKLYRENIELKDKVNSMANVIQNYKTVEKSMQKALVLAEKSADETKEAARAAARTIEDEARANAELIIASAEQEKQAVKRKIITLLAQYDAYRSQYRHLVESQLDLLESEALQVGGANLDKVKSAAITETDTADSNDAEYDEETKEA